jgi:hypothetical protein
MINGFKGVVVFSAARSGTTLLIEQLTTILSRKNPTINVKNLYELFDTTLVFDTSWNKCWIDHNEDIPRPATNAMDIWRLDRVISQSNDGSLFPVFKIFMNDITPHNWPFIRELINDEKFYKISLLRKDVCNTIYSGILGRALNRWEKRNGEVIGTPRTEKYFAEPKLYNFLGTAIMRNFDWAMFHQRSMNDIIWYYQLINDQIAFEKLNIDIQDMANVRNQSNSLQKINTDHQTDISLSCTNHKDIIDFARSIDKSCQTVIKRIAES